MFFSIKIVYKSTLVNQLNGNLFLSKDMLIEVKDSIYYNYFEDYISVSCRMLLGIGMECSGSFEKFPSL